MYGHNYQVTFKINTYESCIGIEDFKEKFKKDYPGIKSEFVSSEVVSLNEFWKEIDEGLNYRGDYGSGLSLNNTQNEELKDLQKQYKHFIQSFITAKTKIFRYKSVEGMPCYPVFWGYQFILQSNYYNFMFLYGCSSD